MAVSLRSQNLRGWKWFILFIYLFFWFVCLIFPEPGPPTDVRPANEPLFESRKKQKNWDKVTTDILSQEKDKTTNEDPNAGGDAALNGFFQQLYSGADEDSKRAMMKSFVESGGTTLSTNWDEVGKAHVDVKPPEGYVCSPLRRIGSSS